jgi:hypothetical protein
MQTILSLRFIIHVKLIIKRAFGEWIIITRPVTVAVRVRTCDASCGTVAPPGVEKARKV